MRNLLIIVQVLAATGVAAETIRLPVPLQETSGAFGARWTVRAFAYNGGPTPVVLHLEPCRLSEECEVRVESGKVRQLPVFDSMELHPPEAVRMSDEDADAIQLNIRARNLSDPSDLGTELQVPRTGDLSDAFDLFPVGIQDGTRVTLRIIATQGKSTTAIVTLSDAASGETVRSEKLLLHDRGPIQPAYVGRDVPNAILSDVFTDPTLPETLRVNVRSEGGDLIWGFITITDNATNQIETVTPR